MTYPAELKAVRMDLSNKSVFLDKLKELDKDSPNKNKDWWPWLLKNYNTQFSSWYLTFHKDELISFSAVQLFGDSARLCSRLWNGIRKPGLERGVILNEVSPAMLMIELQLQDYKGYNYFFSMELLNRRSHLEKFAEKLNIKLGRSFKLNEYMHQTCRDETFKCWQSTISEKPLNLPEMKLEEWRERFGR